MLYFYILLGIVQGVLEWLPVSSEGQLILISIWSNQLTAEDAISLAFWLHLGTMASVLFYYRGDWKIILDIRKDDPEKLRNLLVITTIGTAVIGIPIKILILDIIDIEKVSYVVMWIIAISLMVTGALLHYSRKTREGNYADNLSALTTKKAFIIGCAQGFSIIPGISRSGTTVSALLFSNQDSESSFRGSFLMSVPAALGSVVLDILFLLIKNQPLIGSLDPWGILLAIIFSFILGTLTMHGLIKVARKYNFAVITVAFGSMIILFLLLT